LRESAGKVLCHRNAKAMSRPSRRDFFRSLGGLAFATPIRAASPAEVTFADTAAQSGLGRAVNVSGAPIEKRYLIEEMGGGVALFDYDNDGWLDIFLVNGTTFESSTGKKPASYLFRNNRDGTFTDVTQKAGLTVSGWGQGCCVGDYDNDGFDDLFVSYWGRNVLYHNNGDGTFSDVSEKAGVAGESPRWGAGCCFLDYDRDGHIDLFVANYVAFNPNAVPKPGGSAYCRYNSIGVPCGPQGLVGGTNILYRNRGNGTFEDVSEKSGIAIPRGQLAASFVNQDWRPKGSYGMGAVAADFDNDGWPDIYVACDTAPSLLYHNNHDGTFREIGVAAGCAFDENGTALSGMGVGVGDYDGDGWLDIVRTNFSDQITTVYRNNADGTFHDASMGAGLASTGSMSDLVQASSIWTMTAGTTFSWRMVTCMRSLSVTSFMCLTSNQGLCTEIFETDDSKTSQRAPDLRSQRLMQVEAVPSEISTTTATLTSSSTIWMRYPPCFVMTEVIETTG
jgi:enediyne biosynthesis protein E4